MISTVHLGTVLTICLKDYYTRRSAASNNNNNPCALSTRKTLYFFKFNSLFPSASCDICGEILQCTPEWLLKINFLIFSFQIFNQSLFLLLLLQPIFFFYWHGGWLFFSSVLKSFSSIFTQNQKEPSTPSTTLFNQK